MGDLVLLYWFHCLYTSILPGLFAGSFFRRLNRLSPYAYAARGPPQTRHDQRMGTSPKQNPLSPGLRGMGCRGFACAGLTGCAAIRASSLIRPLCSDGSAFISISWIRLLNRPRLEQSALQITMFSQHGPVTNSLT